MGGMTVYRSDASLRWEMQNQILRLSGSGKVTIYGAVTPDGCGNLGLAAVAIGNAKGRGNIDARLPRTV
jgi:hypothetical protein